MRAAEGDGGGEQMTNVVVVSSGVISTGMVVSSGTQVLDYGTLVSAAIQQGGEIDVESGGFTRRTAIAGGGLEWVLAGGLTSTTTVSSGATQDVASAGVTSGTIVQSG